jgi:hypothetical protein
VVVTEVAVLLLLPAAATSEELENLLQQLSQYEEQLMGDQPLSAEASRAAAAADAASDVGTSMSSLSWSATLAGLARLLPQNDE